MVEWKGKGKKRGEGKKEVREGRRHTQGGNAALAEMVDAAGPRAAVAVDQDGSEGEHQAPADLGAVRALDADRACSCFPPHVTPFSINSTPAFHPPFSVPSDIASSQRSLPSRSSLPPSRSIPFPFRTIGQAPETHHSTTRAEQRGKTERDVPEAMLNGQVIAPAALPGGANMTPRLE